MNPLTDPWPWWIAGPAVGVTVPILLVLSGKRFGISSSFQHVCAAVLPSKTKYLSYPWRQVGGWNLIFAFGLIVGGALAVALSGGPWRVALAPETIQDLAALGVAHEAGLVPPSLFSWQALTSWPGAILMIGGGFLVGFGARYAGGCTSGHGITGIALLQRGSFAAAAGFFVGGIASTYVLLPWILR